MQVYYANELQPVASAMHVLLTLVLCALSFVCVDFAEAIPRIDAANTARFDNNLAQCQSLPITPLQQPAVPDKNPARVCNPCSAADFPLFRSETRPVPLAAEYQTQAATADVTGPEFQDKIPQDVPHVSGIQGSQPGQAFLWGHPSGVETAFGQQALNTSSKSTSDGQFQACRNGLPLALRSNPYVNHNSGKGFQWPLAD
eukprot:scaffold217879_cov50-Prasinocladus_malaysianus.AAC.1